MRAHNLVERAIYGEDPGSLLDAFVGLYEEEAAPKQPRLRDKFQALGGRVKQSFLRVQDQINAAAEEKVKERGRERMQPKMHQAIHKYVTDPTTSGLVAAAGVSPLGFLYGVTKELRARAKAKTRGFDRDDTHLFKAGLKGAAKGAILGAGLGQAIPLYSRTEKGGPRVHGAIHGGLDRAFHAAGFKPKK